MTKVFTSVPEGYPYYLYLAKSGSSSSIGGSAIIALLAAILGFVSAYVIYQIQRRNEPRKRLSWELQAEQAQLAVSDDIKERVSVLYRDRRVQNLAAATCTVSNTGNRVIKNERIRFNFGDRVDVLEHSLYPPPEPELDVVQVDDHGLTSLDFVYRIGQLEIDERVKFLFVLASQDPIDPGAPHATNEEGDVQFIRRGTERTVADQEHLQPFFIALFAFFVVPLVLSPLSGEFHFNYGGAVLAAVRVVLLIPILPHLVPVARLTEQLIVHYLSSDKTVRGMDNEVSGGQFYGPVVQGRNFSEITFSPPSGNTEESATAGNPEAT